MVHEHLQAVKSTLPPNRWEAALHHERSLHVDLASTDAWSSRWKSPAKKGGRTLSCRTVTNSHCPVCTVRLTVTSMTQVDMDIRSGKLVIENHSSLQGKPAT